MRAVIHGDISYRYLGAFHKYLDDCDAFDFTVSWRDIPLSDYDLVITQGMRRPANMVAEYCKENSIRFITVDLGYMLRPHYMQVGPHLNWLPTRSMPTDRFNKLSIQPKPYHSGDYILIAGQKAEDASHNKDADFLSRTYQDWIEQIEQYTSMPILFRPHPKDKEITVTGVEIDTQGISESLATAHAVVTYHSTFATDAILAGAPIFTKTFAQAAPLALHSMECIEYPLIPTDAERLAHLAKVAYAQWTIDEIESGKCLETYLELFL